MQTNQMSDLHYLLQSNLPHFLPHHDCTTAAAAAAQKLPNPLHQACAAAASPKWAASLSSNSTTSDEAEDPRQVSVINERKQRRMISNRESARRSRMRKQRHLDELWSQVVCLRNENHQLVEKLSRALESHDRMLREHAQVSEEAAELRQMLSQMQLISSPSPNHLPSTSQFD